MAAKRNPEAGYALLFIFMMAAMVGLMLYRELPRAAFEKQRDREQLLVDRGHEYIRGVQLYVKKFNKYPSNFDALEKTNNMRFLRRRYIDPMTGKDDWRLLHVGPNGILLDSKIHPVKKEDEDGSKTDMTLLPTGTPAAGTPGDGANLAARRRLGDSMPGAEAPGLPNGVPMPPISGTPNAPPPFGPQGATGASGLSAAANMINQILTTPRPGGLNGVQTPIQNVVGGGLAGVASKAEREGIKSVGDRTSYDEWEFYYNVSNDKTRGGAQGQGQPGQVPVPGGRGGAVPVTGRSN